MTARLAVNATLVAAGILFSRLLGLARESLKARYLGASGDIVADAFSAAFRIPNLLQNLFGEGALSASMIPVYASLLAKGDRREADRVAGAIGAALGLVTAALVLLGIAGAPLLVDLIAMGFEGERRDLTVRLTRILFPGAALFVFSAWCLGILNSHRRFFLSYAAPVAWNGAMIAVLIAFRGQPVDVLVVRLAWASVAGAALQFLVQLPVVLRVAPELKLALARGNAHVNEALRNFVPAFFARGVAQINAFVDQLIGSFLPVGSVALLWYGQSIAMLPVSFFGMSIAAAELPEMSSAGGDAESAAAYVRKRLQAALDSMAYFVVPSAAAMLLLGNVITAALFQHGRFTENDTQYTWGILGAAAFGLTATTMGRLYSSAFYALRDTRTPLRFALLRVTLAAGVGWVLAMYAPGAAGLSARWGVAALALASAAAGWAEFLGLRSRMRARVGDTGLEPKRVVTLWGSALLAGGLALTLEVLIGGVHRFAMAGVVLGAFVAAYFGLTAAAGEYIPREAMRRARALFA